MVQIAALGKGEEQALSSSGVARALMSSKTVAGVAAWARVVTTNKRRKERMAARGRRREDMAKGSEVERG